MNNPDTLDSSLDLGEEFCTECGEDKVLLPDTGWCLQCTRRYYPNRQQCISCGESFNADSNNRERCNHCKYVEWMIRNADKIEDYIAAGLTYGLALVRVTHDNRPVCLSCGTKIKGGTRGRHFFCTQTAKCRTAARRYIYLKNDKGLPKQEAIDRTVASLIA